MKTNGQRDREPTVIYIVSGMPRSGTTCMMRALEAGGMTVAYSENRDQMAAGHADQHYQPNPDNKLYEIPLSEYGDVDFPLKYEGKLIKVMLWGLDHLAVNPDGYRIIIMRRDPEEIRQSCEAFGIGVHPWLKSGEYGLRITRALKMLYVRTDVLGLEVVNYRTLFEHPELTFEMLKHDESWPINAAKATATINPDLYRFRRERLTVGI